MKKPSLKEIEYLGKMYAQDAWGNYGAKKAIIWLESRLKEEMDKNMNLEIENFRLSCSQGKMVKNGLIGKFLGYFKF